jgi:hypothetical protein
LIKTLVIDAIAHYKHRETRQLLGFNGPSLIEERLAAIEKKAQDIQMEDIKASDAQLYPESH